MAIVIKEDDLELLCDLSNGAIFNDLEWPVTQISNISNMSLTVQDKHI